MGGIKNIDELQEWVTSIENTVLTLVKVVKEQNERIHNLEVKSKDSV